MSAPEDIPEITVDELAERLAAGALVIDVREPDEYTAGHVPSARPIPLGEVPDRAGEVPTDQTVYFICARGGRSRRAAEFVASQGVDAVNVAGGTMGWIEAGHEVVTGEQPG
jgi:rhodanese-related sulfurtransferase